MSAPARTVEAVADVEEREASKRSPEVRHTEELIAYLEPDQLVAETSLALPRAPHGRRRMAALWALRVFALVVSAMVIYTFVAQLH